MEANNQNNQGVIIEGDNPNMIWAQIMDYLSTKAKVMRKEYTKRTRSNSSYTWNDIDLMYNNIRHDLEVIMTGNKIMK